MPAPQWYSLIRFRVRPECLTGVCQARTAAETLLLLDEWERSYQRDTTVVFNPRNRPLERTALDWLIYGSPARRSKPA